MKLNVAVQYNTCDLKKEMGTLFNIMNEIIDLELKKKKTRNNISEK